ncbi:MAG: T9SS type A sorting domain-containing protein, partial [Bacteroidetes bacterium]|nr:T9SS type A sorting domain-containing protein [Bacteroidota bacterium]
GANTYGTNRKSNTSSITINRNLYITGTSIFDAENNGVSGNGGLTMDGGLLRISKVSTTLPELTATASGQSYTLTGGKIEIYGTTASQQQTFRAKDGNSNTINYYNLDFNASAANTTDGNINPNNGFNLQGTLNVNSPCILRLDANDIVAGSGSFVLKDKAGLFYTSANGITTSGATGQITLAGSRSYSKKAGYGFIGAGNMVSGNGLPDSVAALYIDKNASSNIVSLNQSVTIADSVSHRIGILSGTATPLVTYSNNAVVNLTSDNSFVDGQVQKEGDDAFVFPVGKIGTGYQPIAMSAPDHISDAFAATYFRGNPRSLGGKLPSGVQHITSCEYWQLNEVNDAGSSNSISVTMHFNANSGCDTSAGNNYITDLTKLRVLHHNGTRWENMGNHATTGDDNTGSITVNNITSFSPFAFGSTQAAPVNPLPVVWGTASVERVNNLNYIQWTVSCEKFVDRYEIEYSADHQHWTTINSIEPNDHNGCIPVSYTAIDSANYQVSMLYYRIKEVDFDGQFSYSNIMSLQLDSVSKKMTASFSSNPSFGETISIYLNNVTEGSQIEIINQEGKLVYQSSISPNQKVLQLELNISGVYYIKTTNLYGSEVTKLVKF